LDQGPLSSSLQIFAPPLEQGFSKYYSPTKGQALGHHSDDPHENKYPLFSPDHLNYNLAKYFMEWRTPNPDPEVHNEADHDKAVL
jgi:hypothetical protein